MVVDCLRLAVRLQVERRAKPEFDPRELEQILPHIAGEHGSRSLTMEFGNPCRRTMASKNALATDAAVYG